MIVGEGDVASVAIGLEEEELDLRGDVEVVPQISCLPSDLGEHVAGITAEGATIRGVDVAD